MEVFVSSALLAVLVLIQLILVILEASLNLWSHLFSFFAQKKKSSDKICHVAGSGERSRVIMQLVWPNVAITRNLCCWIFVLYCKSNWHKCVSMRTIIWQQTTSEIWAMAGWVNSHSKSRWQNMLWRGSKTSITLTDPILPAIHHHSHAHLQPNWLKQYDNMELAQ